ncbi:hypothetical protein B0H11DRAFT_2240422 [Mycena galericulata]|nr:hypothetical protein B0H11DRAFT_2240422 [Mycena galericulata]
MSSPQEIIDMIIDYVNLDSDPENRLVALRSCALVGRRFSRRSQMHLFSVVNLLEDTFGPTPPQLVNPFSRLLKTTTHIAPLVKELYIQPTDNSLEAACHVLRSLPKLEVLDSRPIPSKIIGRRDTPPTLFKALAATVTLPTLRCLDLNCMGMVFPDAAHLDSFLEQSVGLSHLKIERVAFVSHLHQKRNSTSTLPCVVLDALTLRNTNNADIQAVVHDLSAVDVGHLKQLSLHRIFLPGVQGLLRINAHSIQEVHVKTCEFNSDILAGGSTLHSIYIYLTFDSWQVIAPTLRFFGSLRNLNALKSITLNFSSAFDLLELVQPDFRTEMHWLLLDGLLAEAGDEILAGLTVYIEIPRKAAAGCVGPGFEDIVRQKLLSLGGKVVVRVTDTLPSV